MSSQAIQDYLKTIYDIQREQGWVATTVLAKRLGIKPASVTNMVKKLAELKLVVYKPYEGLMLTETGQKMALEVLRHHRLIELYLGKMLGLSWDQVHAEAEKWEHVLSEDIEERIDTLLGHPTVNPHGAPIPSRNGTIVEATCRPLTDLEPGQSAVITEVSDHNPALLRYLGDLGLYPGVEVKVIATTLLAGIITVRVGAAEHILGCEAAQYIYMTEARED
jgi:DtxR family transcriptional regulator, Mn-dependent transcriptional regulator